MSGPASAPGSHPFGEAYARSFARRVAAGELVEVEPGIWLPPGRTFADIAPPKPAPRLP